MKTFKLSSEQINFLKKEYSENPLIKQILFCENQGVFEVDVDVKIDLMDFIEDEAVSWMNDNYEATKETIILESIRDDIYNQTN